LKEIRATGRFLRDLRLARKRGKDLAKIEVVIDVLGRGGTLPPKHRRHRLRGELEGMWECHIEPDWLLIWDEGESAIVLVRCGSHADLFE
jgi:mRNA interferase YafQ